MIEKIFARQIKACGEQGGTLYYLIEDDTVTTLGKAQFDGYTVPQIPDNLEFSEEFDELFPVFKVKQ